MNDAMDALVTALQDDATIDDLTDGRVFYGGLPRTEVDTMPRKCIVVTSSGRVPQGLDGSYVEVERRRFDVRCYGEIAFEAQKVYAAVDVYMKRLRPTDVLGVRLFNAMPSAGPMDMVEPDQADWTFVWASYGINVAMAGAEEPDPLLVVVGG